MIVEVGSTIDDDYLQLTQLSTPHPTLFNFNEKSKLMSLSLHASQTLQWNKLYCQGLPLAPTQLMLNSGYWSIQQTKEVIVFWKSGQISKICSQYKLGMVIVICNC